MITLKHYADEPGNWRSVAASSVVHLAALLILFSLPVSVTRSVVQAGPSTIKLILPRLDTPLTATTRPKPAAGCSKGCLRRPNPSSPNE